MLPQEELDRLVRKTRDLFGSVTTMEAECREALVDLCNGILARMPVRDKTMGLNLSYEEVVCETDRLYADWKALQTKYELVGAVCKSKIDDAPFVHVEELFYELFYSIADFCKWSDPDAPYYSHSESWYDRGMECEERIAEVLQEKAERALEQKDYDSAIVLGQRAWARCSVSHDVRSILYDAYIAKGDIEEASRWFWKGYRDASRRFSYL